MFTALALRSPHVHRTGTEFTACLLRLVSGMLHQGWSTPNLNALTQVPLLSAATKAAMAKADHLSRPAYNTKNTEQYSQTAHGLDHSLPNYTGRIQIARLLGGGSYGNISVAVFKESGTSEEFLFAIKKPRQISNSKDGAWARALQEAFRSEIRILRLLKHPNVLELRGVLYSGFEIDGAVTQYYRNGDMRQHLSKHPMSDRSKLLLGTCAGLEYLHAQSIIHNDLKIDNILVSDTEDAIIADFGLSRTLEEGPNPSIPCGSGPIGGAVRWWSPEKMQASGGKDHVPITAKSDVFAYACVAWEVTTNEKPYPDIVCDIQVIMEVLVYGRQLPSARHDRPFGNSACIIPNVNVGLLWELVLLACWRKESTDRPSMTEVRRRLVEQCFCFMSR